MTTIFMIILYQTVKKSKEFWDLERTKALPVAVRGMERVNREGGLISLSLRIH
jgi:hypothetical protein